MPATPAARFAGALLVVLAVAAVVWFTLGRESSDGVRESGRAIERASARGPTPLAAPRAPRHAPLGATSDMPHPSLAPRAAPPVVVRSGGAPLSTFRPQRVRFVAAATHMSLGDVDWEIEGPPDSRGDPVTDRGRTDADGHTTLPPSAVSAWADHPLSAWVEGAWIETKLPPAGFDPRTELQLEIAVEGVPVRISGTLIDEAGRPIPHGGVYLDWENAVAGQPGAEAGGDGHFALDFLDWKPTEGGIAEPESEKRPFTLHAVAIGFGLTTTTVPRRGAEALKIRFARNDADGSLRLRLRHADGSPATDARAWVWPDGRPLPYASGVSDDREGARRRDLLARLRGGGWFDGQGMMISEENDVNDLRADENGEIRVAALPAGSYRILATARAARRGIPIPIEERISDDWLANDDGDGVSTGEIFEGTCRVAPPPQESVEDVHLLRARRVVGRIVVDERQGWTHARGGWHWLGVEGWFWAHRITLTGPSDADEDQPPRSGRFELEGVPRGACRLAVVSRGVESVYVDVPEARPGSGDVVDVGTIHVRNFRTMRVTVSWSDGSKIDTSNTTLSLERYAGHFDVGAWSGSDDAGFHLNLYEPLGGSESFHVEVTGSRPKTYVLPVSIDDEEHLDVTLTLPDPPPPKANTDDVPPGGSDPK